MRRADTRAGLWSEAGRGGALEGRLSIVVDEGSRRRRGFGADPILLAVGRAPAPARWMRDRLRPAPGGATICTWATGRWARASGGRAAGVVPWR